MIQTPTQWEYKKAQGNETEKAVSVFTTWEMSFEQLEAADQERDSIIHLLTLAAFIDTNNVSEGLFSLYSQQPNRPPWLDVFMDGETWDSNKYQDTVVHLKTICLVTTMNLTTDEARISFHPVVAEWLKLRIEQVARAKYMEEAIRVIQLFIDNGDKKEMSTQDKSEILGHLDKIIVEHDLVFQTDGKHVSNPLKEAIVSFGSFYRRLGHYEETSTLIKRAMGENNVSPAVMNVLANMYCDHGELEEAEKLYNRVLTSFGKSVPEIFGEQSDITTLQFIYWTQDDKLTEDGRAYVGDLTKDLRQFGPWFVSLLSAYNGLGVLFMKRGRLCIAEELLKQALEGRERTDLDATSTATIVLHLGTLYTRNGDYDKAEDFLRRALDSLERMAGPDYITTQVAIHNLGILRLQQDRLNDAEQRILRTTQKMKNMLGPVHAITLSAIHNQALLFRKQGKIEEAESLLEKTIEGWKESGRGVAKPEADSKYCLAELYVNSNEKKHKAKRLFREAAELYSRAIGDNHPQTIEAFEQARRCAY